MRIALTENKKDIFVAYGIGYGKYFIGIGWGDNARIEAAGLAWLLWIIYARVPFKYRQKIRAWHKAKPPVSKPNKLYRLDLNLWEQKIWFGWRYSINQYGKPYVFYRIKQLAKHQAKYLLAPYKYAHAR